MSQQQSKIRSWTLAFDSIAENGAIYTRGKYESGGTEFVDVIEAAPLIDELRAIRTKFLIKTGLKFDRLENLIKELEG